MQTFRMLPAVGVLALVACSLDTPARPNLTPPELRIVNAAPSTATVTAHLNGLPDPLAGPIPFGSAAECVLIFPATYTLAFQEAGNTRGSVSSAYDVNGRYTVILVNTGATYRALALSDAVTVSTGNNGLRFINASGTPGDIYVSPPTEDPADIYNAVGNLAPLALTTGAPLVVQRAETHTRIRLFDVGTTTTARADFTLEPLITTRLATIVFIDRGVPTDPGGFQVDPCL
jgi:Domain of unknown function (DUF4397)